MVTSLWRAPPWRFPDYVQTPKFLIAKKFGRAPRDLEEIVPYWIVSGAMRSLLERVDPEAVEFRPCATVLPSGEPGPEYWLCTVSRAFVGAVDLERSENLDVGRGPNGRTSLTMNLNTKLAFHSDVLNGAHLFRVAEMGSRAFCDQFMKDACKTAGLAGVRFWQRS
jgi:hypothetical protein